MSQSQRWKREQEIFDQAFEIKSPGERSDFLRKACGDDSSLFDAVQALFLETAQRGEFLPEEPVFGNAEKLGDQIGLYVLIEKLGDGGFGIVYLAQQETPVRRQVALKVIKPGMDTRSVIARFQAEKQALALMNHPNIAKVFDAGATLNARPYFVMELVRGGKITDHCNLQNLGATERIKLFIQVCQAIQHAHQKGVIHRDIKPSNILVTLQDGVAVPKVIDFGIAKAIEGRLGDNSIYTGQFHLIGTLPYMSPEQVTTGGVNETTSDIYSLGVLLYELLTGKTPLDPKALAQAGVEELRRIVREEEPLKPSSRLTREMAEARGANAEKRPLTNIKDLIHRLRGDVDCIVMKCLDKDKIRRYRTAADLADDLQRHLDNEPIEARPAHPAYVARKLVQRHKIAVAAVVSVMLALTAGFLSTAYQAVRASRAEQTQRHLRISAEEQEKKARAEFLRAEATSEKLRTSLAAADFSEALRQIGEDDQAKALAYLARSLKANPTNQATATRLMMLLTYQWTLPVWTLDLDSTNSDIENAQITSDGTQFVTYSKTGEKTYDIHGARLLQKKSRTGSSTAQLSPDGKKIANIKDDLIEVFDSETGTSLIPPLQHNATVAKARFSPNGKRILSITRDERIDEISGARFSVLSQVRMWDAETGKLCIGPIATENPSLTAEFSTDSAIVATCTRLDGGNAAARLWSAIDGHPLTPFFDIGGDQVNSAAFNSTGRQFATATTYGLLRIWDAKGILQWKKGDEGVRCFSPVFSEDGKKLVTVSADSGRIWDAQNGQPIGEPLRQTGLRYAQFSPDGKRVLGIGKNQELRIWDSRTGKPLSGILRHGGRSSVSAAFSPDGRHILSYSSRRIRLWDGQNIDVPAEYLTGTDDLPISQTMKERHGDRIIKIVNSTARVWDETLKKFIGGPMNSTNGFDIDEAKFSPDGTRVLTKLRYDYSLIGVGKSVVSARPPQAIQIWNAETGERLTPLLRHSDIIFSMEFSRDGKQIATGSQDDTARVFNSWTGEPVGKAIQADSHVWRVQFSPDGQKLAVATMDGAVRIWDIAKGQAESEMRTDDSGSKVEFSPDGLRIVTASGNTARLWDTRSGAPLAQPLKHGGLVSLAQFSPDGSRILTLSENAVRIWNAWTGEPLSEPMKHESAVHEATFTSASSRIVMTADNGPRRAWDISPAGKMPDWLIPLAESLSPQTFGENGVLEYREIDSLEIDSIRKRIEKSPISDEWNAWGRWFLMEPSRRTLSSFSKSTLAHHISNLIQERNAESLNSAERLALHDSKLLARISQARSELEREKAAEELVDSASKFEDAENYSEAANCYRKAIEKGSIEALNSLAWLLATCNQAEIRNGIEAVEFAEKAVSATNRKEPSYLDTLAAAFAESNDFAKAIEVQTEAIALEEDYESKTEFESRLDLYQNGSPLRTRKIYKTWDIPSPSEIP